MSILYAVAPIGNSTNAQKGPTCWYYAAKMVAQCHEPWPPADQKWISLVRKISTHVGTGSKSLNAMSEEDLGLAHRSFQISEQNKRTSKLQLNSALRKTGYKALEPEYKWDTLPPSMVNPINMQRVPMPNFIRQQDLPLPFGLQNSLNQLEDQQFDDLESVIQTLSTQHSQHEVEYYRSQIQSSFIPARKHGQKDIDSSLQVFLDWRRTGFHRGYLLERLGFKSLSKLDILEALRDASSFDKCMKKFGPLWCSSTFGMGQPELSDSSTQNYSSLGLRVFKCPLGQFMGLTAHAITLCGVSTKKNCIYYRDPNMSGHMFWSDFPAFASGFNMLMNQPNVGLMYYEKNADGGVICNKIDN